MFNRRTIIIIAAFSVTIAVVSICLANVHNTPPICDSIGCRFTRSLIDQFHDPSEEPCQYFYYYACGRATETVRNNFFEVYQNEKYDFQNKLLSHSPIDPKRNDSMAAAVKFYRACTGGKYMSNVSSFDMLLDRNMTLYWDLFRGKIKWTDLVIKARNAGLRYNFFIDVSTVLNPKTFRWVIKLEPVSNLFPNAWQESNRDAIKILLQSWRLNYDFIPVTDMEVTDLIYRGQMLSTMNRTGHFIHEEIRYLGAKSPFVPNWLLFLKQITKIDTLDAYDEVLIDLQLHDSPNYRTLFNIILNSGSNFWFNYMALVTILDECFFLEGPALTVCNSILQTSRCSFCENILHSNFEGLFEAEYIRKTITKETRQKALDVISQIQTAFKETINVTPFSNPSSRNLIVQTLDKVMISLTTLDVIYNPGEFEKYYGIDTSILNTQNLSVSYNKLRKHIADRKFAALVANTEKEKFLYYDDLTDVNDYIPAYMIDLHFIRIPPNLLYLPYFSLDRPHYLNVAMFGTTIAHEIVHSILDLRASFRTVPIWNSSDDVIFRDRIRCVTEQYDKYLQSMQFFLKNPEDHIAENLADIAPASICYNIFLDAIKSDARLLVDENVFSKNQLYWILRFANLCEGQELEQIRIMQYLTTKLQHGLPVYRLASGPMNDFRFGIDFNCKSDEPMNPKKKCKIFGT